MADKRALSIPGGVNEQIKDTDNLVTGRIQTVAGTANDPAVRFQSEASGMLLAAAGTLGFSCAGTQYLSLTSTVLHFEATASGGPIFELERLDAPTGLNPYIGYLTFQGLNTTPATYDFGYIFGYVKDNTAAAEIGGIAIDGVSAGVQGQSFGVMGGVIVGDYTNFSDPGFGHLLVSDEMRTGDGAVGSPSHSFYNDPDSGMLSGGANILQFGTAGAWRFQVAANGLVSVNPALNYETLVTGDDDIPNKAYVDTKGAFPGISQIIFVDKTGGSYTPDGTIAKPYNDIPAAITAANALTPSISNRIAIVIYPGIYTDGFLTTDSYVDFVGIDKDTTVVQCSSGIPIRLANSYVRVSNMTFETTVGAGNVLSCTTASIVGLEFNNCKFFSNNATGGPVSLNQTGIECIFRGCDFIHSTTTNDIYYDYHATYGGRVELYNCHFEGQIQAYSKDFYAYGCYVASLATYPVYIVGSTSKIFRMYGCTIVQLDTSGYAVYIQVASDWALLNCDLRGAAASYDIHAGGDYPGTVSGCTMAVGMSANIRLNTPIRNVGGTVDYYKDISYAIDSIDSGDYGIVELHEDITMAEQSIDSGANVLLRGNGHTITASSTYCFRSTASSTFTIENVTLSGGGVSLSTTGSLIKLKDVIIDDGHVNIASSADGTSKLVLDHVICASPETGQAALEIQDADCPIYIWNSYLKGSTTYAVEYDTDNSNLYIAHSTIMGSGVNNPFENPTGATTYTSHHCAFNIAPEDNTNLSNTIDVGQRYNTIDPDADFGWLL